jgi:hypothetical protein
LKNIAKDLAVTCKFDQNYKRQVLEPIGSSESSGGKALKLYAIDLVIIFAVLLCCAPQTQQQTEQPLKNEQNPAFTARSIIGYWRHRGDGLETHITQVVGQTAGSGSFKDFQGRLYPAGKFRNIQYRGGNRWSCQQYVHSPSLRYPENELQVFWQDAVIEMIDHRTFRVGNDIYDRI